MKIRVTLICLMLVLSSGCASKNYNLGTIDTQQVQACDRNVEIAIEDSAATPTAEECQKIHSQAAEDDGHPFVVQMLAYLAGYMIGSALF